MDYSIQRVCYTSFMNLLEQFLHLLFPSPFTDQMLSELPSAPITHHHNIFSCYNYQSPDTRKLVRYLKNHRDPLLTKKLGRVLYEHMADYLADQHQYGYFKQALVIPVPLSKQRKQERGFNQTQLLAKNLSTYVDGSELCIKCVIKKETDQKQSLTNNRQERFNNVKNRFSLSLKYKHLIQNRDIILVDDLVTTGATLKELEKVLEKAGARTIIAVTLAH